MGFKWFVDGLLDGSLGFGGEESAGASFLRRDGTVWTTDKDGIILALLAAEMLARTGKDPGEIYRALTEQFGAPGLRAHRRSGHAGTEGRAAPALAGAGDGPRVRGRPDRSHAHRAPGNGAPIGGLKVVTHRGWFAARPSGTENVYKIYAESFAGEAHLRRIQAEAREIVSRALAGG